MYRRYMLFVLIIISLVLLPSTANAANGITLNGSFSDWDGQSNLTDRTGDAFLTGDITKFAWATNNNDSNLYFMIKRNRSNDIWDMAPAFYKVSLDMNDNGIYWNGNDRYLLVSYFPHLDGLVMVSLFRGNGKLIKSYSGYWGEAVNQNWGWNLPIYWGQQLPWNWYMAFPDQWGGTLPKDWTQWFHREWGGIFHGSWGGLFLGDWRNAFPEYWNGVPPKAGSQCEFNVSMDDLGMYPGQPIRMYAESIVLPADRVPDHGDIQWSPIPIMPVWALGAIFVALLAVGVIIIKRRRVA